MQSLLTIGTRSSPLALIQAKMVRDKLLQIHGEKNLAITIKPIVTSGDKTQKYNLSMSASSDFTNAKQSDNFGLFSKEIELQILSGEVDIGVHSAKDMVSTLPKGLVMDIFLQREDRRDAFISLKYNSLLDLPKGAIIGTSSVRRHAQILRQRPDIKIIEFRGNIETRINKLKNNIADATILAIAGLKRLGKAEHITQILDEKSFLPAPAQGAIGIEYRQNDEKISKLLAPLNHQKTFSEIITERSFLTEIDGSCRTPIACSAKIKNNIITINAQIFSNDKQQFAQQKISGTIENGERLGKKLANLLLKTCR